MVPDTLPWYRSQIIVAALISVLTKLLVGFGLIGDVAPDDQEQLANTVVLVLGGLADIWAMRSRVVQKVAPSITLKKET